jgi:hypothetical protein
MLFAISSGVFDRIQFRCTGWQTLQMDAAVLLSDVFSNQPVAVREQTIPDDREPSATVLLEVLGKPARLRASLLSLKSRKSRFQMVMPSVAE